MLYRVMIDARASITLYAEVSASSKEEAEVIAMVLPLDELEADIDTIHETGLIYACPA